MTTERDANRPFFTTPGDVTGSDQENKRSSTGKFMSTDSMKNPLEEQRSPFSHSNPFPQKPEMKVRRPHVVILDDSITSQEGMPKMSAKEELESSVPTERSDPRYHESHSTVT